MKDQTPDFPIFSLIFIFSLITVVYYYAYFAAKIAEKEPSTPINWQHYDATPQFNFVRNLV